MGAIRNKAERDRLVVANMGLARKEAHYFHRRFPSEPWEDLYQIGLLGLTKAMEKWDPARGYKISSFVVPFIRGEITHFLRDHGHSVKVPASWRDLYGRYRRLKEASPTRTDESIAEELGVPLKKLLRRIDGAGVRCVAMSSQFDHAACHSFAVEEEAIALFWQRIQAWRDHGPQQIAAILQGAPVPEAAIAIAKQLSLF